MTLPADLDGVVVTGYVDEQTKHDALAGAAVVLLAVALREPLDRGARGLEPRPPDARERRLATCSSGSRGAPAAGLWYADAHEFHATLALLLDNPPLAAVLGAQGRRYVAGTGGWEAVRRAWLEALLSVPPAAR